MFSFYTDEDGHTSSARFEFTVYSPKIGETVAEISVRCKEIGVGSYINDDVSIKKYIGELPAE